MGKRFAKWIFAAPRLIVILGVLSTLATGAGIGFIVVQTEGAPFALVNLAFNQIGYWLAASGLQGITRGIRPSVPRRGPEAGYHLSQFSWSVRDSRYVCFQRTHNPKTPSRLFCSGTLLKGSAVTQKKIPVRLNC